MAEITPLLPRPNRLPREDSIFQCVCYLPWYFIRQRGLLAARSFLALYLTTALALAIVWESGPTHGHSARVYPFYGSIISFTIQAIYYWTTAIWTFKHLTGPHSRLPPHEQAKGRYLAKLQNAFSIPKNTELNSKRRLTFSMFYTAAVTFPLVVTLTFWLFLYPLDFESDPSPWPSFLRYFKIVNFPIVNSIVALLEVMMLSSVRKQKPLVIHLMGVNAFCIAYSVWVALGRYMIGQYIYPYFDLTNDWRTILQTYTYLSSLAVNVFMTQRALHALRERIAWKAECDRGRR